MNKIEVIKSERDGLTVRDMIAHYAEVGWEAIPEDDIQRLKWYGLFLRNPTPGHFMLRVRMPGGQTTSAQLDTLADIALQYGNGHLHARLLRMVLRERVSWKTAFCWCVLADGSPQPHTAKNSAMKAATVQS